MFGIEFWGVRGSIPCPGEKTVKYGGNTSCLRILTDLDYQIIVDFGSGSRSLGNFLLSNPEIKKPLDIYAFITHTHWDHINGFPFFVPIYIPATTMKVHGPGTFNKSLSEILSGQLMYEYFPVNFNELKSQIEYFDLKEGEKVLPGGVKVKFMYLNHPVLCLGYRFEYQSKAICTCYDHEQYMNLFSEDPDNFEEGEKSANEANRRLVDFFRNADILVHDAQYTTEEYPKYTGWGHSTIKYAIEQALKANVKNLILFHHDPERTDDKIDLIKKMCDEKYNSKGKIHIEPAYEGLKILL